MKAAAQSVYYFGVYLYAVGLTLIVVPNFFYQHCMLPKPMRYG